MAEKYPDLERGESASKTGRKHYIRYDVLYAYVLSRLRYWPGLAQHNEERLQSCCRYGGKRQLPGPDVEWYIKAAQNHASQRQQKK